VVFENPNFAGDHGPTFYRGEERAPHDGRHVGKLFWTARPRAQDCRRDRDQRKTTTTFILKHLLSEPKVPVGLIGTVRYEIRRAHSAAPRTTPESLDLHDLLAQMKTAGCRATVMEVFVSRAGAGEGRAD